MIEKDSAEILLILFYGLSFSHSANTHYSFIIPKGIGHIQDKGLKETITRALTTISYLLSNAIFLLFSIYLINNTLSYYGYFSSLMSVTFIIFLSAGPWYCDHLTRYFFWLILRTKWVREKEYFFVDRLYTLIYSILLIIFLILIYIT